jgi:hypothetical protein
MKLAATTRKGDLLRFGVFGAATFALVFWLQRRWLDVAAWLMGRDGINFDQQPHWVRALNAGVAAIPWVIGVALLFRLAAPAMDAARRVCRRTGPRPRCVLSVCSARRPSTTTHADAVRFRAEGGNRAAAEAFGSNGGRPDANPSTRWHVTGATGRAARRAAAKRVLP